MKAKSRRVFGLGCVALCAACHDARSTADATSAAPEQGAILNAPPVKDAASAQAGATSTPSLSDGSLAASASAAPVPAPAALPTGVSRTPESNVPAGSLSAAVTANNEFGVALFAGLHAQSAAKNFLTSPISASLALGMTCAGAKEQTRTQMARALHFGAHSAESIFEGQNGLSQALSTRGSEAFEQASKQFYGSSGAPSAADYSLQVVNSLWGERSYAWNAPFLASVGANYGAGLSARDFKHQANATRLEINAWVSAQTNDKIQNLLPEPAVTSDTRLVLVNALHLKLPWQKEFEKSATKPGPFTRTDHKPLSVPFMHREAKLAYIDDGSAQIVALPLSGGKLSLIVALPHAGTSLASYEQALKASSAALHVPTKQELVALALPKVTFTSPTFSLADVLKQLGMVDAFVPQRAHFEGMATVPPGEAPLVVGDVLQKTMIAMQETGIEAAAATAVTMMAGAALIRQEKPPVPIPMIVNRPYLIAVVDEPTGALLMLGHIDDPS